MPSSLKHIFVAAADTNVSWNVKNILTPHYRVHTASCSNDFDRLLQSLYPHVIVLDMDDYGIFTHEIKKYLTSGIHSHILALYSNSSQIAESGILEIEMADFLPKPVHPKLLHKKMQMFLALDKPKPHHPRSPDASRSVRAQPLPLRSVEGVFNVLTEVMEVRDYEYSGHVNRTKKYLEVMLDGLSKLNVYREETEGWNKHLVALSSQLHDIGKTVIPDAVLLKPDKLSPQEFKQIRMHTVWGAKIIEKIGSRSGNHDFVQHAWLMAYTHHERFDGTGYPHGLSGIDIPLEGRLMAVVDVYDALRSKRPYKPPFSHEKTKEIIIEGAETQFDPTLVQVFLVMSDEILAAHEQLKSMPSLAQTFEHPPERMPVASWASPL